MHYAINKHPLCPWDLCAKHVAELRCLTAQPLFSLHGRTPFEMVTGTTPDISEYICFNWFQPVCYYDNTSFPEPTKHLACWIGVAHNIGQAMCFWVLPSSGVPIARSTVQALSDVELRSAEIQEQLRAFDETIKEKLAVQSDSTEPFMVSESNAINELQQIAEIDDGVNLPLKPDAEKPNPDDFDEETYSRFTSAEVLLPKGDRS